MAISLVPYINGYINVNSVDLSDHLTDCELTIKVDEKDVSAMSSAGYKQRLGTLKDASLKIVMNQDFGAASVFFTLLPLLGATVPVVLRPVNAVGSVTNPSMSGSFVVAELMPIKGKIGDALTTDMTWPLGVGALTFSTASSA